MSLASHEFQLFFAYFFIDKQRYVLLFIKLLLKIFKKKSFKMESKEGKDPI